MSDQPIEPCPFCKGECYSRIEGMFGHNVRCMNCGYESGEFPTAGVAEESHNRVARAVQTTPDLLESVNRLLGWVEQESIPGGWRAEDVAFARAAIAKATGND